MVYIKKVINYIPHLIGLHITRKSNPLGIEIGTKKSLKKRQAIIEARKKFGNKKITICEIGVFEGKHVLEIFNNLNVKKIYLIDPYTKYEDYKKDGSSPKVYGAKTKAHELLKPFQEKIVWIEKYSDKVGEEINEHLDFLYIDGNHFSPYIDNDIKNYFPLVRKSGIIAGHDFGKGYPDVEKAVRKFFRPLKKKIIYGFGNDWVVHK